MLFNVPFVDWYTAETDWNDCQNKYDCYDAATLIIWDTAAGRPRVRREGVRPISVQTGAFWEGHLTVEAGPRKETPNDWMEGRLMKCPRMEGSPSSNRDRQRVESVEWWSCERISETADLGGGRPACLGKRNGNMWPPFPGVPCWGRWGRVTERVMRRRASNTTRDTTTQQQRQQRRRGGEKNIYNI